MKVTSVRPFLIDSCGSKSWLFVKVETDGGIVGWGEAYTQADCDRAMLIHLEEMAAIWLVETARDQALHFGHVPGLCLFPPATDFWSALTALEHALWDIAGKACGQPVYNLLGGLPRRDRIRVHANGWSERAASPEKYARAAAEVVARGFDALKFDPFDNPWRTHVGRVQEDRAVERVRAVREAVGPKVECPD